MSKKSQTKSFIINPKEIEELARHHGPTKQSMMKVLSDLDTQRFIHKYKAKPKITKKSIQKELINLDMQIFLHKYKAKPKITKKSIQKELLNLDMQRFLHKHQAKPNITKQSILKEISKADKMIQKIKDMNKLYKQKELIQLAKNKISSKDIMKELKQIEDLKDKKLFEKVNKMVEEHRANINKYVKK